MTPAPRSLPTDTIAGLRRTGRDLTPDAIAATTDLLRPRHGPEHLAPRVVRDLAYAPHARHLHDVHAPEAAAGAPVVVPHATHLSEVLALGLADTWFGDLLVRYVRRFTGTES